MNCGACEISDTMLCVKLGCRDCGFSVVETRRAADMSDEGVTMELMLMELMLS